MEQDLAIWRRPETCYINVASLGEVVAPESNFLDPHPHIRVGYNHVKIITNINCIYIWLIINTASEECTSTLAISMKGELALLKQKKIIIIKSFRV